MVKKDQLIIRIRDLMRRVSEANVSLSAAGLAYYTLFSLFPLLLLLVSIGSALFAGGEITTQIFGFIEGAFPALQRTILENLAKLEEDRGAIGLVGLVTLFWSASNVFMVLNANIKAAWPGSSRRNYLRRRLIALAIVASLVLILILYIVSFLLFQFLVLLQVPLIAELDFLETPTWEWISVLVAWLLIFGLLFGIYHWVPAVGVPRRSALAGAFIATLILFAINRLFTLLSSMMIQRYELVYGSLSSVLAFLVYVYFSSFVVLGGAHITAAIAGEDKN